MADEESLERCTIMEILARGAAKAREGAEKEWCWCWESFHRVRHQAKSIEFEMIIVNNV